MNNDIIIGSQHGFLPGRSCTTNLVDYLNEVTKTLDKGASYDVILVDFQKAFDKVPFDGMLAKAKAHGINGELLKWLENWTISRKQRVGLNGAESDWADVLSSVVQGSVLGPILFLIYINDIDAALVENDNDIYISKFADDTKVGREVNNANDAAKLQICIDNLVQWCRDWGMSLHPDKCVVLHFGLKIRKLTTTSQTQKSKLNPLPVTLAFTFLTPVRPPLMLKKLPRKPMPCYPKFIVPPLSVIGKLLWQCINPSSVHYWNHPLLHGTHPSEETLMPLKGYRDELHG